MKAEVSRRVAEVLKPQAIFASNTSTLPITSLAEAFPDASRFVGIHFFSPVDRMMLTEVILGKETGDRALAVALDFVRAIKKTPIVVNDTRGFFANRCVLRYMTEATTCWSRACRGDDRERGEVRRHAGGSLAPERRDGGRSFQKIMKATIRDMGEGSIDPRHFALVNEMVDGRPARPQGRQGLLRLSGQARQEAHLAGPQGQVPAEGAGRGGLRGTEATLPRHDGARSGADRRGRRRHRSARGGRRLDPRLRLRALYGRDAELHRRDGRRVLRGALREARRETRRALPPDAALKELAARGESFYSRFAPAKAAA